MQQAIAVHQQQAGPTALVVWPESIPVELRSFNQWVAWRFGQARSNGRKLAKEPITPRSRSLANPTDASTWGTLAEAMAAYRSAEFAGIGFVLSAADPFTAIDLDDCRDPATGSIASWAQEIISTLNSYAEISPSGKGIRIFVRGKKPGSRCKRGSIEAYDGRHYVTLTGHHLPDTPETVEPRQQELDSFYRRHLDAGPAAPGSQAARSPLTDQQIIAKASQCCNGHKFRALFFDGDTSAYGYDDSRADHALASFLAYFSGPDPERIICLLRQSALVREKWDRTDYLQRTVANVLERQQRYYQGSGRSSYSVGVHRGGLHIQNNLTTPACRVYFESPHPCRRQGPRKHFRSTQRLDLEAALRPPCGRRNCSACSLAVKQKWMERLHFGIHSLKLNTLHAWTGSRTQWKRVSRSVRRSKGYYFGIRHGLHNAEVFALCSVPVEDSDELGIEQALDHMAALLKPLRGFKSGDRARTLVCSLGWPKPPKVKKWTCEGDVPASSEYLERMLVAEQARNPAFRAAILEPGQAAVMEFQANMPEDDRAKIRDRVLGHTLSIGFEM